MNQSRLPRELRGRIFSTQEARERGLTFYGLRKMVEHGVVNKLARGFYQATEADYSEEGAFITAALQIGAPNAICLVSALTHYKLNDAIPKKVWMMVDAPKRTKYRNIRLLRTRNPNWNIGIDKKKGYWITSLERTLVDAVIYRNLIGANVAMEALRKAHKDSTVRLGKLVDMANRLQVYHRIQPYLEALA